MPFESLSSLWKNAKENIKLSIANESIKKRLDAKIFPGFLAKPWSIVIVLVILLALLFYFFMYNKLLFIFILLCAICYWIYINLNSSKNETWKHFYKIAITFFIPIIFSVAALLIFQHQNKGKIFIETVLIGEHNQETSSNVVTMKLISNIYASIEASEKFVETKLSKADFVSIPNNIELNNNNFLLTWLGLNNIGKQRIKCIISKVDSSYHLDLIFTNVKYLIGKEIIQKTNKEKMNIAEILNEASSEIVKKLYPLHALYLATAKSDFTKAISIGNEITSNSHAVLINKVYKKKHIQENTFVALILTAYSYSELSKIDCNECEQKKSAENLYDRAKLLSDSIGKSYEYHYFYATHLFNIGDPESALKQVCIARDKLLQHTELDVIEKTIKEAQLVNNAMYYMYHINNISNDSIRDSITKIDAMIVKLENSIRNQKSLSYDKIERALKRKALLISTKLEVSFTFKVSLELPDSSIYQLFRYSIEMGNQLDSASIATDPIYRDIIKLDPSCYLNYIEPLIKDPEARAYIQKEFLQ